MFAVVSITCKKKQQWHDNSIKKNVHKVFIFHSEDVTNGILPVQENFSISKLGDNGTTVEVIFICVKCFVLLAKTANQNDGTNDGQNNK